MPASHSKEPDPARAEAVATNDCILRCVVGSTVHGLSNPGTDDRDEMGVCVEPREYVLGLRSFEHWVSRTQPEGVPSGPGDLDLTIYGLRKYCRLALKGSPTVLLLFIDDEHVLQRTPLGSELLGDRHATRTRELADEHGYDTKYAMHALRIAHRGHELLSTGRITLPIPQPAREHLMEVRRMQGVR
jgi:predicted nucleotidyltransferase